MMKNLPFLLVQLYSAQAFWSNVGKQGNGTNSSTCVQDLLTVVDGAVNGELWALQFMDSSGHIPPGLLLGDRHFMGEHHGCMRATHPANRFTGRYCVLAANFSIMDNFDDFATMAAVSSMMTLGICVPSECTGAEIVEKIRNFTQGHLPISVDLAHPDACETRNDKTIFRPLDYVFLLITTLLIVLALYGTIDECYRLYQKDSKQRVSHIFSMYGNIKMLLDRNPGQMQHIHGLRVISLLFIMYAHTYGYLLGKDMSLNQIENFQNRAELRNKHFNMGTYSVETFFILSAFLHARGFLRAMQKNGQYDFPWALLFRYLRLTPIYLYILVYLMSVGRYIIPTPKLINYLYRRYDPCFKSWFWSIIYVNNYYNKNEGIGMCLGAGWFLDVDMQLFLMSPLFLYAAVKRPKAAILAAIAAALALSTYAVHLGIKFNFAPTPMFANSFDQVHEGYFLTHVRAAPYLLGLAFGIFMHFHNHSAKKSKNFIRIGWIICGGIIILCLGGVHLYTLEYTQPLSAFWVSYGRVVWTAGICWIIYACNAGHGGICDRFLSWPPFSFFSKISYSIFLAQTVIIEFLGLYPIEYIFFSFPDQIMIFINIVIFSSIAALILNILIEQPIFKLAYVLLRNVKILPLPKSDRNSGIIELSKKN